MKDRNHNREPETAAEDASEFRYACAIAGPSLGFTRASTQDGLPGGHTPMAPLDKSPIMENRLIGNHTLITSRVGSRLPDKNILPLFVFPAGS